ncbi:hypothetical protein TRAPUB_3392 [Trametes pubescens]|uniref:Histone chaperone RTT106/FACT complex subunit SPT16-like middle domain-containing protein n=1 Tax=Trametes pubescens TaxID=154538 RepID=A0A1M2VDV3_TRAPU|nr:hypothetical protein TRAPUB_3392 [Trametes pubescens]
MTIYLDSLRPLLPADVRSQLDRALVPDVKSIVDAILRLAVGASAPENDLLPGWDGLRSRAADIIGELKRGEPAVSHKRAREDEPASSAKKPRPDSEPVAQNPPLFTLHVLSVSAPIRKKVNISVHRTSIHLTNPSTQKEEHAPIPLDALQRVFLLSTRGKSKPHWTVALLASDTPAPTGKAADAAKEGAAPQLVFGLDATLTAPFTTTTYGTDGSPKTDTYPKGSASLPALRAFLSHIPIQTLEPSTSIFRAAAAPSGDGVAGVEAYRGAKQGTLWFLDEGVLWDGKPCEFFALEHLASAGKNEHAYEGVRTLSATGRTCSVILRRRAGLASKRKAAAGADASDDEEADHEGEDIDFGMVDGKEQEPIGRWVKAHRHRFGRPADSEGGAGHRNGTSQAADPKGKGKAKAEDPRAEDTEDEEDSDFTMGSSDDESSGDESESGSDASADGKGGNGEGGDDDEDEEGNASDDVTGDEAEDDDEVEELDPKHHPLLRPGAMPKMSRAAVDAVVGMVEQDLMGGGRKGTQADDESDEEDELDD